MRQIIILLALAAFALAGTIDSGLQSLMAASSDTDLIPVFILAHGQVDENWVNGATDGMNRAQRQEFAVDAMQQLAEAAQSGIISELNTLNTENITPLWLANAVYCQATPAAIRQISTRSDVRYIERAADENAGLIEPVDERDLTLEEREKGLAWGVSKINADDAWALGYEGQGVIVAVIDTGVDYYHSDLGNNMWHDTPAGYHYGWNFYEGNSDPMDSQGHGTHCAGSVAGDGTAGTETGVAPSATIMAIRINYYFGGESTWIEGMEFATEHGASVMSMSLGSGQGNMSLRTANENALTAGVYHSVAAANDGPGSGTITSPGDGPPPWFHPDQVYQGGNSAVVTVGATDSNDNIASFSSRGPVTCWSDYSDSSPLIDPDISGPGVDVVSTAWNGGYTTKSGTSMATPHLAGVAALILSANPELSVAQMDSIIEMTSLDLGSSGKDNTFGAGRVDAYQAVLAALSMVGTADDASAQVNPAVIGISPVSPNPVTSHAAFTINTVAAGPVDIAVFDVTGRRTANIQTGELTAGANAVSWSIPERMGSGIYFVRASMNGQTVSSRMTVVR